MAGRFLSSALRTTSRCCLPFPSVLSSSSSSLASLTSLSALGSSSSAAATRFVFGDLTVGTGRYNSTTSSRNPFEPLPDLVGGAASSSSPSSQSSQSKQEVSSSSSSPTPTSSQSSSAAAYSVVAETIASFAGEIILRCNKAGVPKTKISPKAIRKRYSNGLHMKHLNLRLQAWYYCPMCAEPKRPGTSCRKESCRMKTEVRN